MGNIPIENDLPQIFSMRIRHPHLHKQEINLIPLAVLADVHPVVSPALLMGTGLQLQPHLVVQPEPGPEPEPQPQPQLHPVVQPQIYSG